MLIYDEKREFNSVFHSYFERDNSFNSYVFFSFVEFLKYYSSHPEIYDDENFVSQARSLLEFTFYLRGENGENIKFDLLEENSTFNKNISLFRVKKNNSNLIGKYFICASVSYRDGFYDYLSGDYEPLNDLDEYQYSIFKKDMKALLDNKYYISYYGNDVNIVHEFYSEYIDFTLADCKISNIYDIFSNKISLETYNAYISDQQILKGIEYDATVPIQKFLIDDIVYNLLYNVKNKQGDLQNHLSLSLNLLNNKDYNYQQYDFLTNIFLADFTRKTNVKTREDYEKISGLESNTCDKEITTNNIPTSLKESDLLYMSLFINNFNIPLDQTWAEDISFLPVYFLELLTKYEIYYLSDITEDSLFETWLPLTNQALGNLQSGQYLCMISCKDETVEKYIIENYFLLEI